MSSVMFNEEGNSFVLPLVTCLLTPRLLRTYPCHPGLTDQADTSLPLDPEARTSAFSSWGLLQGQLSSNPSGPTVSVKINKVFFEVAPPVNGPIGYQLNKLSKTLISKTE